MRDASGKSGPTPVGLPAGETVRGPGTTRSAGFLVAAGGTIPGRANRAGTEGIMICFTLDDERVHLPNLRPHRFRNGSVEAKRNQRPPFREPHEAPPGIRPA